MTVFRALAEPTPNIIAAIEVETSFMMEFLSLCNKPICDLMKPSLNGAVDEKICHFAIPKEGGPSHIYIHGLLGDH